MCQVHESKKYNLYIIGFNIVMVFIVNIALNAWISAGPRVFYDDDLSVISTYMRSGNYSDLAFSLSANKFRPVSSSVIWLVLKFAGKNYEIIDEVLLGMHFLSGCLIYMAAYKLITKQDILTRNALALLSALLFIFSRFAYYNISELLGIMESVGDILAILVLYFILAYLDSEDGMESIMAANICYGLALYAHERYFILFFLFPLAVLLRGKITAKKDFKPVVGSAVLFISFWLLRFFLFGSRPIDGTSGTNVIETFDLHTAVAFFISQIKYILGFNSGPQYLCGIEWDSVTSGIKALVVISAVFSIATIALFVRNIIKSHEWMQAKRLIIFTAFIVSLVTASSVTIRVEMRWVYASYAAFILLMVYMWSELICINYTRRKIIQEALICLWAFTVFSYEIYYRQYYANIYYWGDKDFTRSFYEAAVQPYGAQLDGNTVIIVSKAPVFAGWTQDSWKRFLKPYLEADDINVQYTDNMYKVDSLMQAGGCIVLAEDVKNRRYADITGYFAKMTPLYGIYEDAWIEPDCGFQLIGCQNKSINLFLYYPEDLEQIGEGTGEIFINGILAKEFRVEGSHTYIDLMMPDEGVCDVQIIQNYWVHENTGRSEDGRLSCTLAVNIGD